MAGSETRFAVLLFTDIVGSTDLKTRHGVPAFRDALRTHNDHFERLAREGRGIRILQNMGDGYFAEADSVAEVVKFALLFQEAMRAGPWGEVPLTTRVGIHAGEISAITAEGGTGIVAPAADLAARVMSLAVGGQILLTRFPFDEARHFLREHPVVAGKTMPPLRWLAHGPYLLQGRDEPLDIFEVGAEGLAPLVPPPDGEKAKRAIRPGEEETLGWRPAAGLEIPGRTGWHLTERLGVGGFGEVWVGEHGKLHQRRAFKFCFDDERLRALKREVTLVRLLRNALGDRDDIVRIHELKLDAPPFYLESDLAPHGNLLQWAESQGGLDKIPLAQRIALVAHTATALAAAHSIGVLHKDIKPTNILIFDGPGGEPRPRLVDFGIGTLADPGILAQQGITGAGFTRMTIQHSTGTPTYSPPEYLAGRPYTIQGDIYGLGVLLYQLVTVKPLDPLAQGWEREIADPLLREDIATCVDGDPARRFPSAADLAERLLHLDARRAEIVEKERLIREAAARAEAEAAALADRVRLSRFRKLAAVFAVLAVPALLVIAGAGFIAVRDLPSFAVLALLAIAGGEFAWVYERAAAEERTKATTERDRARTAGQEAEAVATFLTEVFSSPDPARDGRTITVAETLDRAVKKLDTDLGNQPARQVRLQRTLGLTYNALGLYHDAIPLLEKARDYSFATRGPEHADTLLVMQYLGVSYYGAGRVDEALKLQERVLELSRKVLGPKHPDTLTAMNNLAGSYGDAGRWDEAFPLWIEASARLPKDTQLALKIAALQLWFGKDADHATTCRRMLELAAGTDDASTAERAAKAYCLRPSSDPQLIESAVILARRAVELGKNQPNLRWYQMALGIAEYRHGDYPEADQMLSAAQEAGKDDRLVHGTARFFHAMSLFKQTKLAEARQLFAEAEAQMPPLPTDENQPLANGADADSVIVWLAYKEAKALLQAKAPALPTKPAGK